MSIQSHVDHLKRRHQELDESIFRVERNPAIDHLNVVSLKRAKLRLKDEIERFEQDHPRNLS